MHIQLARQLKALLKITNGKFSHSAGSTAARFIKEEQGAVAIIFALTLMPLILLAGAAIDYSRFTSDRQQLQDALDAASLAAVNRLPTTNDDDDVRNFVRAYVAANIPADVVINVNLIEIERNPNKVKVWANGSTETTFMQLAQINSLDFRTNSEAVSSAVALELAMVLDNSGSMRRTIGALQDAASELITSLEGNQSDPDKLKVGLVPFNHLIRVNKSNKNASWLDQNARSPLHRNANSPIADRRLPSKSNRFELFQTLTNVEWEGCMEARKHPLDIRDTAPSSNLSASYFVPYFLPSGKKAGGGAYVPNKLTGPRANNPIKDRYGKYYNRSVSGEGPNNGCYIQPITPLTTNMSKVRTSINAMVAKGGTNIHMGTIWGTRVLSSQAPFTEGAPQTRGVIKILIVMSDGANYFYSNYSPYGPANEGRISGSSSPRNEMNVRTLEACEEAKRQGIQVYTVAYGRIGAETTNMLKKCANSPDFAFTPKNNDALIQNFKKIAESVNNIRISH